VYSNLRAWPVAATKRPWLWLDLLHLRPGSNEPFPFENQMSAIRLEPQEVLKHGIDGPFSPKAILMLRHAGGSPLTVAAEPALSHAFPPRRTAASDVNMVGDVASYAA
jgi:hypothetical protein